MTTWLDIDRKAEAHLSSKHAHLTKEDYYFQWSTLRDKMEEALEDGVITAEEFEAAKATSGSHWTWARNS